MVCRAHTYCRGWHLQGSVRHTCTPLTSVDVVELGAWNSRRRDGQWVPSCKNLSLLTWSCLRAMWTASPDRIHVGPHALWAASSNPGSWSWCAPSGWSQLLWGGPCAPPDHRHASHGRIIFFLLCSPNSTSKRFECIKLAPRVKCVIRFFRTRPKYQMLPRDLLIP